MTDTRYHQVLRTSLVIVAFTLVFDGGFVTPISKHLSDNTINYVANSVGVLAQIEPNELNTLAAELAERERQLNARDAALREIEARDFGTGTTFDISTYILSSILFLLTVLIITNYVLDWRRAHPVTA
jgi:hypothetical protein